jgi:hypothetical protein
MINDIKIKKIIKVMQRLFIQRLFIQVAFIVSAYISFPTPYKWYMMIFSVVMCDVCGAIMQNSKKLLEYTEKLNTQITFSEIVTYNGDEKHQLICIHPVKYETHYRIKADATVIKTINGIEYMAFYKKLNDKV